jgi:signal transduction histidine kinase
MRSSTCSIGFSGSDALRRRIVTAALLERSIGAHRYRPYRRQSGAGLGLPIAKWIVQMHRGSIDVESELGKGFTLRVRVPLE